MNSFVSCRDSRLSVNDGEEFLRDSRQGSLTFTYHLIISQAEKCLSVNLGTSWIICTPAD